MSLSVSMESGVLGTKLIKLCWKSFFLWCFEKFSIFFVILYRSIINFTLCVFFFTPNPCMIRFQNEVC